MKDQLDVSLAILFHFLCAQHVSDINISIIRSLRLCWRITTSVVLLSVRCVLELLVRLVLGGVRFAGCSLQNEQHLKPAAQNTKWHEVGLSFFKVSWVSLLYLLLRAINQLVRIVMPSVTKHFGNGARTHARAHTHARTHTHTHTQYCESWSVQTLC